MSAAAGARPLRRALFRSFFDAPRAAAAPARLPLHARAGRRVTKQLRRRLADADALVTTWDSPRFGEELRDLAPRLRLVAHCGGEVKGRFARPLFDRLTIANAPGPMAPYVAELAVTFLLHVARGASTSTARRCAGRRTRVYGRLHLRAPAPRRCAGGPSASWASAASAARPRGCCALRASAARPRPYVRPRAARGLGVELVSLARLLRESDDLVVAAALTDATRGLLGRAALRSAAATAPRS